MNRWLSTEMLQSTIKTLRATRSPRQSALGRLPSHDEAACSESRCNARIVVYRQTMRWQFEPCLPGRHARPARRCSSSYRVVRGTGRASGGLRAIAIRCRGESMRNKPALLACMVLSSAATAQDAVLTDGDKYHVILENAQVRVLEYHDNPGDVTRQHHHPAFVLYALAPFRRSIALPDGKVLVREFKAGDAIYSEAQTHIGSNVGDSPTHVIIIEMKVAPSNKPQ